VFYLHPENSGKFLYPDECVGDAHFFLVIIIIAID